jgi:DNA-binding ferritin-like protein
METYQWINFTLGVIAIFGGGLSTVVWYNFKSLDKAVGEISKALGEASLSSKDRMAMLSERLALMDYAKVSKEELYQAMEIIAQKIEKAIEDKQRLRDQRTEDNYLRLEAKLEELVKEFRNSR